MTPVQKFHREKVGWRHVSGFCNHKWCVWLYVPPRTCMFVIQILRAVYQVGCVAVTVWHAQEAPATLAEHSCGLPQFLHSYRTLRSSNGPWLPLATYDHLWTYSRLMIQNLCTKKKLSFNVKTRILCFRFLHLLSFL